MGFKGVMFIWGLRKYGLEVEFGNFKVVGWGCLFRWYLGDGRMSTI